MREVYDDIAEDEAHFRATQIGRYSHLYSVTLRVPNDRGIAANTISAASLKRTATLQIEEDAEFHITHMTASVVGPVGANSDVRSFSFNNTLPMAGVTAGRADRGIVFRITEAGSGRLLTRGHTHMRGPNVMGPNANYQNGWWGPQGYLALESVFPPAYGFELAAPVAFEYHLERNKRLVIDLANRDSDIIDGAGDGGHVVTFAFLGQRYDA